LLTKQQKIKTSSVKKANTPFYATIGLIAIVIIYILIVKRELHKQGILLNAKTTNWASGAKVSLDLKYEFYYNGKKIIGANAFNDFRGNLDFLNRFFPVMYYPGLGGNSQLLIGPEDFKEFYLPFPDSLKWVLPYLNR
jgi:hypothetical protein